MSKVFVIGGGPAGMFAALAAARAGCETVICEQNEKLGKKLFITGKGRCNLTNACDTDEIFENIVRNRKFMYSAVYSFDNFRVMNYFEESRLPLKTERGGRVFPCSDHSSDVIGTLKRNLKKEGVSVRLNTKVKGIQSENGEVSHILFADGKRERADAVILATGGCSYPSTGSTGDGYRFAGKLGHHIVPPYPSLVPFTVKEDYVKELMGLSLKNVTVTIRSGKKKLFEEFGEMLFTHFGVSGPIFISASSKVNDAVLKGELAAEIDLKPALTEEMLDRRILRDFEDNKKKRFANAISKLYPAKLLPVIVRLSGIPPEKKVNEITLEERKHLISCTKHFSFTLTGLRGFEEAIITRGGIDTKEVNPSTMESKLVRHLYFAGEVLDVDALTGGFNLQIAWSTGYLAGISVSSQIPRSKLRSI